MSDTFLPMFLRYGRNVIMSDASVRCSAESRTWLVPWNHQEIMLITKHTALIMNGRITSSLQYASLLHLVYISVIDDTADILNAFSQTASRPHDNSTVSTPRGRVEA
jgi:hypothetical protein